MVYTVIFLCHPIHDKINYKLIMFQTLILLKCVLQRRNEVQVNKNPSRRTTIYEKNKGYLPGCWAIACDVCGWAEAPTAPPVAAAFCFNIVQSNVQSYWWLSVRNRMRNSCRRYMQSGASSNRRPRQQFRYMENSAGNPQNTTEQLIKTMQITNKIDDGEFLTL